MTYDLFLWFENTKELWDQADRIAHTLLKKLQRGEPICEERLINSQVLYKISRSTIASYIKEFPGTYVSIATSRALRTAIGHRILEYTNELFETT